MNSNLPPERLQLRAPRTLPQRAELCRRGLTSADGADNRWTCQVDGTAVLASVVLIPPPAPVGPTPTSSSAAESLVVAGHEPGSAEVRLRLGRSWSPDALAEHHLRSPCTDHWGLSAPAGRPATPRG